MTEPTRSVVVGAIPLTLVARFRPDAPPSYERWQFSNYTMNEIQSGVAAPNAPSGRAGLSNFELDAFGMNLYDELTDEQRRARLALSLQTRNGEFWLGYTRLNDSFTDVRYTLKITSDLTSAVQWRDAVIGEDLEPVRLRTSSTNRRGAMRCGYRPPRRHGMYGFSNWKRPSNEAATVPESTNLPGHSI